MINQSNNLDSASSWLSRKGIIIDKVTKLVNLTLSKQKVNVVDPFVMDIALSITPNDILKAVDATQNNGKLTTYDSNDGIVRVRN